ncbi:MAG TPA: membrane protein insertase YidC [Alphaproteobacteria bacterium]|nr:membrane protein insertase YidC [Alphaproteobacteria bacterium]
MSEQRNLILAIALSLGVFVMWSILFPPAPPPKTPAQSAQQTTTASPSAIPGVTPTQLAQMTRPQALAQSQRVQIDAPRVSGSINLTGAMLDDLDLKGYHDTIDPKSPLITLLSPRGAANAYYTEFGWTAPQGSEVALPGPTTQWTVESGSTLTATSPVTLKWDNGQGLIFHITYAIDANYMFTVTQSVDNQSGRDIGLVPYGVISRLEAPKTGSVWFAHEGFAGWISGSLKNKKWKALREDGSFTTQSTGGWLGFTDKYWMASLIPPQKSHLSLAVNYDHPGGDATERFATAYQLDPKILASGATLKTESHFFAGAKEVSTIDNYESSLHIDGFDRAIDWGWAYFLTKPIFMVLEFFKGLLWGNLGLAILAVTVCVKLIFFPLANRSFETAAKMKKLQPQLKEIQERYKDDKVELQKQMAALYQREKLNPLAGCLPVLLQIPVWYSLYNVLFITIEMRQAPFFGWVRDLSARDPSMLGNLFGLLHYDPLHIPVIGPFIAIGVWPLIMGLTMFVQTGLTPTPATDPTQKMIFTWMPVLWTFMLASMPVGLVIYWTWNNFLSILQQAFIMQKAGTPVDLSNLPGVKPIARLFGAKTAGSDKSKPGAASAPKQ